MYLCCSVFLFELLLICSPIELDSYIVYIKLPQSKTESIRNQITKRLNVTIGETTENPRKSYTSPFSYYYEREKKIGRIIGGELVPITRFPYNVMYGQNCGGAIIAQSWVMTAAHCKQLPTISAGVTSNSANLYQVREHFVHPLWHAESKKIVENDYDFQLLLLEKPMIFSQSMKPVRIGRPRDLVVGKLVTVTGFGQRAENGATANGLRSIRLPVISTEQCTDALFAYFMGRFTERMFCAGYLKARLDACQGDSGSPAVMSGKLVGLVSFGYGCALPGTYGVYSNVTSVRSWVEQVTRYKLDELYETHRLSSYYF